jgi:hypothetical protein
MMTAIQPDEVAEHADAPRRAKWFPVGNRRQLR